MNEQKQDLLAFLRDLQFVIERHRASMYASAGFIWLRIGKSHCVESAGVIEALNGECSSLAEAIERLESELTPQRETPDEDGTSYV